MEQIVAGSIGAAVRVSVADVAGGHATTRRLIALRFIAALIVGHALHTRGQNRVAEGPLLAAVLILLALHAHLVSAHP